jgi:predicted DNA-binding protein (MmcQ/YjbR family)
MPAALSRHDFDAFCASLTASTHVVQWQDCSVWKVGGKMFAIFFPHAYQDPQMGRISFKVTDMAFEILPETSGIVPAPYLARAKWLQVQTPEAMSANELEQHLTIAHSLIAGKLSKKLKTQLGL